MKIQQLLCALCLGISITMVSGCGSNGPRTHTISGEVTFDGQPIKEGRILFRNTEGDGKAYSATITDGKYELECETGKMQVEVTASRIIPGKFDNANGVPEPVGEMYIPKQYNTETTLNADVSSSERTFNFELKSKP